VEKSKPLPNYQKIVLTPAEEICFVIQIKVSISHYNSIHWSVLGKILFKNTKSQLLLTSPEK